MKNLIICIVLILIPVIVIAQLKVIHEYKGVYIQGETFLDKKELKYVLSQDAEAYRYVIRAQKKETWVTITGVSSIVLFTTGLVKSSINLLPSLLSDEADRRVKEGGRRMLIGIVLGVTSIILKVTSKDDRKKAIKTYNCNRVGHDIGYSTELSVQGGGLRIKYAF